MTTQIPPSAAASAWTTAPPAEAGFAPDLDARFEALQASGRLKNLHGVVVLRDGDGAFERYLSGHDETKGQGAGDVNFGPETLCTICAR